MGWPPPRPATRRTYRLGTLKKRCSLNINASANSLALIMELTMTGIRNLRELEPEPLSLVAVRMFSISPQLLSEPCES